MGYLAKRYPGVEIRACNSTARAAELAKEDENALAICSIKCAEVYGLEVVDTDIQDGGAGRYSTLEVIEMIEKRGTDFVANEPGNTTRFVVISLPSVPLSEDFPFSKSQST